MRITVRPMSNSDNIEQIADWFQSIGTEWLLGYENHPRHRAESRQHIEEWMHGEDGRSCILIAESHEPDAANPQTIGFAICLLREDPNTDRLYGTINGIYVSAAFREQQVGRTLKEAADNWCRDAGAAYMKAHIGIGNEAMLRVCKLLGYQPRMITMIRQFD